MPGRYNHLARPRRPTPTGDGLWQVPVTVLPGLRLPLSWIWFRNLPERLLTLAARRLARRGELVCVYFHAWELCDLETRARGLPWPLRRNTGPALVHRLARWAAVFEEQGYERSPLGQVVDALQ